MKTQFTVDKEFILEAHESACSTWKNKIENQFPDLFPKVEINKWYKHNKFLLYVIDRTHWYGFDGCGNWNDYIKYEYLMTDKDLKPATDKEVETALIAEAKRRGFKEGVACISTLNRKRICGHDVYYNGFQYNQLLFGNASVFKDGKWAEIISEPIEVTLEQIAEKFNVNVEQLKIKK